MSPWAVAIIGVLASCCLVQFFGTLHLLANAREHEREAVSRLKDEHAKQVAEIMVRHQATKQSVVTTAAVLERTYTPDPGVRDRPLQALRETIRTGQLESVGFYDGTATEEAVHRILTLHGFHRNADGTYRHAGHTGDPTKPISVGAAITLAIEADKAQARRGVES